MNLADRWVKDEPVPPVNGAFHDEVEEVDEDDEVKDGCGGVVWHTYVLKKSSTSNKLLHELAREVRGREKKLGRKLNGAQYKAIYDKWEAPSRPYLRSNTDYFTEFLAKLDCVTVPKGETLKAAFERAKLKSPPEIVLLNPNWEFCLFASLCRELQELAGDQPFMLCQLSVAKLLFGHSHHKTVWSWVKALKTLGLLRVAEHWKQGRSTRYLYVE